MRTRLDPGEALLNEVISLGALLDDKHSADTVALQELANRLKRRQLSALRGRVAWEGDLDRWRDSRSMTSAS